MEIVTGIAGTGKTEYCLERYRHAIRESNLQGKLGTTLWITPTHRAGQAVLKDLMSAELTCFWSPGVMTFDQFAEQIVQRSGLTASMLNPAQRRMLIESVIREIDQQHRLDYFHQISETSGFVKLISSFISELKRDETWPQHLEQALEKRPPSPKDQQLYRIYDAYQQKLHKWKKYDAEGRFWLARSELAKGNWAAFPELKMVVVDGFTDFTSTQYEMLNLLASHAESMLVVLPTDPADARKDLFAKPAGAVAVLNRFTGHFEVHQTLKTVEQRSTVDAGIDSLRKLLFQNPRESTPAKQAQGVSFFSALGPRAEVRETARRVKQLLLEGVPADQILVTSRDLESQQNLIEEIWTDAGIPYFLAGSKSTSSLSLARSLMTILRFELENWSFPAMKNILRHLRISLPGMTDFEYRGRICLNAVRSLNLRSGQKEILRLLESRASREQENAYEQLSSNDYAVAYETLRELQKRLASLHQSRTYSEQVMNLLACSRDLLTECNTNKQQNGLKHQAMTFNEQWDFIAGMLREAALFQDQLVAEETDNNRAKKVTLSQFAAWLEEQFHSQTIPAPRAKPGEVMILPASDVRHLCTPYLFVTGLQEGAFPQNADRQPFYSEQERRQWNELGVPLSMRESQYQEEMQFFYRLLTRASRQVTLSYSRVSSKGQPQYASAFYQSVLSLFDATAVEVGKLSPVPETDDLLTLSEVRMNAVEQMFHSQAGLLKWWQEASPEQHSAVSLLAAVGMNAYRFEQPGFSMFEGTLNIPDNLQALQARYNDDYTFSATKLESYANCPFRFFMDSVLKLSSVQSPKLATDYARRGNIVHDALSQLHENDLAKLLEESSDENSLVLAEKFLELLAEKFNINYPRGDLQTAIDQIERKLITEWGELYCDQTSSYSESLESIWEETPATQFRELSFGSTKESEDTDKSLPAIHFGNDEQKIKVEGRIDRIDVGRIEGQDVFTVIDYKTGMIPRVKTDDVSAGTGLQLALYAVAVMRLKLLGEDAIPWQVGYWGIKEKGYEAKFVKKSKKGPQQLAEEVLANWEEELDRILPAMVNSIRQGEFPVYSADEKCTERCPYSTICRVNQIRSLPVQLEKNWSFTKEVE